MDCAEQRDVVSGGHVGGETLVPPVEGGGVVSNEVMDAEEDATVERDDHLHWTGIEAGDQSGDQGWDDLSVKFKDMGILTGLLETMVILWEGSREALQQTKAKALKGQLVEAVGRGLPVLFDWFKVSCPHHSGVCVFVCVDVSSNVIALISDYAMVVM